MNTPSPQSTSPPTATDNGQASAATLSNMSQALKSNSLAPAEFEGQVETAVHVRDFNGGIL